MNEGSPIDRLQGFENGEKIDGAKLSRLSRAINRANTGVTKPAQTFNQVNSYQSAVSAWDEADVLADSNISLSGTGQTIDGIVLQAGMVVLATAQDDDSQNGLYNVTSNGNWTPHTSFGLGSGQPGPIGTSGQQGDSGYSGAVGAQGYSGTSGSSGYSGISGAVGSQGLSGTSGTSGTSGFSGFSGIGTGTNFFFNPRMALAQYGTQLGGVFTCSTYSGHSNASFFNPVITASNIVAGMEIEGGQGSLGGQLVAATSVPNNSLTGTNTITYTGLQVPNFNQFCSATSGSALVVGLQSTAGLYPGMIIGYQLPTHVATPQPTILTINSSTAISMSQNANQTGTFGTFFGVPNGNTLVNGQAAQCSGAFCTDRWLATCGTSGASNVLTTKDTMVLYQMQFAPNTGPNPDSKNYLQIFTYPYANVDNNNRYIEQRFENSQTFANQSLTVSFWAGLMTAASAATSISVPLNFQQNFGTGGSPSSTVNTSIGTASITTTMTQFSFTFTVPSVSGKILGTQNDFISVQLKLPSPITNSYIALNLTDFILSNSAIQMPFYDIEIDLARCMRYYEKSFPSNTPPQHGLSVNTNQTCGAAFGTTAMRSSILPFMIPKRTVAPTIVFIEGSLGGGSADTYGNWSYYAGGWIAAAATTVSSGSNDRSLNIDISTSGLTTGSSYIMLGEWIANAEI